MIKNISKAALVALATSALTFGCSSDEAGEADQTATTADSDANTTLNFDVLGSDTDGNEYTVNELSVVVTDSADVVVFSETINVSGPDATVSLSLALTPGSGYTVSVSGVGSGNVDTDGDGVADPVDVPCSGEATFNVVNGANPPVELALSCFAPGADTALGEVDVDASFTFERRGECGAVTGFVGPTTSQVDGPGGAVITLNATATDGASISWEALPSDQGSFGDASSASTTFDCEVTGSAVISMIVTNEAEDCEDVVEFPVECASPSECGNGDVEVGEQCDDGPTGSATCNPPGHPRECRLIECGNNSLEGTEECDDGNTTAEDGCSDLCVNEFCGDGVVQAGLGEACEAGDIQPVTGFACIETGADACQYPPPPSCDECAQNACPDLVAACDDAANGTHCRDVLACYESTGCAVDAGADTTVCLCGTYDAIYCAGGQADGACQSAARAAANPGGNPTSVLNTLLRWTDSDFPVGDANLLADCQRGDCGFACPQY